MSKQNKIKVLLIEDIKVAQKVAKILLEQLNCFVTIVDTGKKAINTVKKENYQLIFLDLGLPDIDGIQVAQIIRKIKGQELIPIVALTANVDTESQKKCLLAGINDYIVKPLSLDAATRIIKKKF